MPDARLIVIIINMKQSLVAKLLVPIDVAANSIFNGRVFRSGNWFNGRCPCHEDKSPSCGIVETDNGNVIAKCFAGCHPDDIIRVLEDQKLVEIQTFDKDRNSNSGEPMVKPSIGRPKLPQDMDFNPDKKLSTITGEEMWNASHSPEAFGIAEKYMRYRGLNPELVMPFASFRVWRGEIGWSKSKTGKRYLDPIATDKGSVYAIIHPVGHHGYQGASPNKPPRFIVTGYHIIFLSEDGKKHDIGKRCMGSISGEYILMETEKHRRAREKMRIVSPSVFETDVVGLCEGVETGWAWTQVTGYPVMVGISASNLPKLARPVMLMDSVALIPDIDLPKTRIGNKLYPAGLYFMSILLKNIESSGVFIHRVKPPHEPPCDLLDWLVKDGHENVRNEVERMINPTVDLTVDNI
ncbi:MAG: hypothetical protein D6732_05890 [Methanobacteriota archaeon]|nr:MAG: hypothetical protein D6732_05890 [Euryarchaeota archaeon]